MAPSGTVESFAEAFATLGYMPCDESEVATDSLAVMAIGDEVTHLMERTESGMWSSEIGGMELIEHGMHDPDGDEYGTIRLFLKRTASQRV